MSDSARTLRASRWLTAFGICFVVIGVAGLAFEAALGWMKHGERIFLDTLAAGWALCF
ncbi:hypothetical protein [Fulvimarina manganoxydans]|uniref:hypothetical protein n=1 Tax=Fulvimarina manganoxydans TaxID=937218 RepID=UPI00235258E0|nr:hypothetical protein [Fulvimarina manganoxydans]